MPTLYVGLVHGPVKNKKNEMVTTSVTNLDIHDIARSCRTFGVKNYFLITPIILQQQLVKRITDHWSSDVGNEYNPDRSDALSYIHVVDSVEIALREIENLEKSKPILAVTGANFEEYQGDMPELIHKARIDKRPIFLIFGTGWGLHASLLERAEFHVTPIFGSASDGYNHLSVRSAVAIYLDRYARGL